MFGLVEMSKTIESKGSSLRDGPDLRRSPGFPGYRSSMKGSRNSVLKKPLSAENALNNIVSAQNKQESARKVRFEKVVRSLMNGIVKELGPENGRTISKKGIKKGLPPFTGPTNFSSGRMAGKYELSYRTVKDEKGNIKYIFTTKYGDPENPTEYHELWWDPMEEKMMKLDYRTAVQMGQERRYTTATSKEAHEAALFLRKELNDEKALENSRKELNEENALKAAAPETSTTEGGTRKRKQKNKQKTKKQRTNRK